MATRNSSALRKRLHAAAYWSAGSLPLGVRRRLMFLFFHRQIPHFARPRTFSEKVNWRILNDRSDRLAWTCDKLAMKDRGIELAPSVRVPRTYWSGTDVAELADVDLPDRWVLKANHRSGLYHLGEGTPDIERLRRVTARWLGAKQGRLMGEWAYTKARPLLLVEERLGAGEPPEDFKIYVFDGVVELIEVHISRATDHTIRLYTPDWRATEIGGKGYIMSPVGVPRPEHLDEMLEIAAQIGAPFDFMRVDLYDLPDGVYLGETSPYPGSGLDPFEPVEYDEELGTRWVLPQR